MAEDKKISEAVELLLKGAKMLSYHCPDCMLPVFQQDKTIFCPHCRKEFALVEEGGGRKIVPVTSTSAGEEDSTAAQYGDGPSSGIADIEADLLKLLKTLIDRMDSSSSTVEMRELAHIMKELAEVYRMLTAKRE